MIGKFYVLGDAEPPIKWREIWEYGAWRAAVLKDESADEALLQELYAEHWEPVELYKVLLHGRYFKSQIKEKKSRQITVDKETADKRVAKAIWVECGKLLLRRMTPEARKHISELSVKMESLADIIVYR